MIARLTAAVLLTLLAVFGMTAPAHAAVPDALNPGTIAGDVKDTLIGSVTNDPLIGGAAGAVGSAVTDTICPSKEAPRVQSPSMGMPWSKPGGETLFQKYGYAGLSITTYDQGCIAQIKTSGASSVNDIANSLDELINAVQVGAVSDAGNGPVEEVLPEALGSIGDAYWGKWMPIVASLAGVLLLFYAYLSRSTAALAFGVNFLVVLGMVPFILANSHYVTDLSSALTTEAAQTSSEELLKLHPSTAGSSAEAAFGDGYYAVGFRSHIDQQYGSHEECAAEFAPKFIDAKAFSYDQMEAMGSAAKEKALVKAKNDAYHSLAKQMEEKYPACYETWANPADAWSGVGKHAATTVFGGSWLFILGLAIQAVEFLLLFGLVAYVSLGVIALVRQQLSSAFLSIAIAGVLGPACLSLLSGGLMFFFYVMISDPESGWVNAIIAGSAMGIGMVLVLAMLGPALIGAASLGMATRSAKRGRRNNRVSRKMGKNAAAAAGGAAVGSAIGGRRGGGDPKPPSTDAKPKTVGFNVPRDVDASSPPKPSEHPVDGAPMPSWLNTENARVATPGGGADEETGPDSKWGRFGGDRPDLSSPAAGGSSAQTDGMAQDWSLFDSEETPMSTDGANAAFHDKWEGNESPRHDVPTADVDGGSSGWANMPVPEPTRDLVKDTWARATAGRGIGDPPPTSHAGVDG